MALPPGPRAPVAVQTAWWVGAPDRFLERCARRFGDPCTIRIAWAPAPLVLTWDPDRMAQVFRDASVPDGPLRAGQTSTVLEPFAGPTSILLADGEEHLARRRAMLPAFHGEALRAWRAEIAELAAAHVDRWRSGPQHGALADLTLEVVLRVVFGARDASTAPLRAAIRRALALTHSAPRLAAMTLLRRPRTPYGTFVRAVAEVDRELLALIERTPPGPGSALALLKPAAGSPRELRDALVTLLAAGHETTATALAWALERLARAPGVPAGTDEELGAIADETLRVRPVLSIAPRRTVAPYRLDGHRLPAGVGLAPCLLLAMRDPRHWGPDAHVWRPSRWLDGSPTPAASFVPWGGGTRRCLGAAFARLEMVEVLRAITARWTLTPDRPQDEPARRRSVTIGPGRGATVMLAPR
jgi:cytochrome P450